MLKVQMLEVNVRQEGAVAAAVASVAQAGAVAQAAGAKARTKVFCVKICLFDIRFVFQKYIQSPSKI